MRCSFGYRNGFITVRVRVVPSVQCMDGIIHNRKGGKMKEEFLTELKALLPPDNSVADETLLVLLRRAENTLLDIIGRSTLPERLSDAVTALALIMYNRMGTEGETRRSEGGIDTNFIDGLPDEIKQRIKNYPRKAGALYAAQTQQN